MTMKRFNGSLESYSAGRGGAVPWDNAPDVSSLALRGAPSADYELSFAGVSRCGCAACTGNSEAIGAKAAPSIVPTDSIDWGSQLDSNRVTVYFAEEGEAFGGTTSRGWTDYEISRAMAGFETYANVSTLQFSITDDADSATFKLVTTKSALYLGSFNPPGEANEGVGNFSISGTGWDDTGGLEQGGYGFITLIHEFGHGLGMAHPHDDGGTSTIMQGVRGNFLTGYGYGDFDLNQGIYTTMSYNDGWQTHPDAVSGGIPGSPDDYGYQGGPMALDIALIQEKYGVNETYNADATRYFLPDANEAGTFWNCIWDAGGVDALIYQGSSSAQINLGAATLDYSASGGGLISYADGIFGGYTIANGVLIENAKGGSGADVITGNEIANRLRGRDGADVLIGGGGKDMVVGGGGDDTFVFDSVDAGDADIVTDFSSGDTLALVGDVYGLAEGALRANAFVIGTQAGDSSDRLIYDGTNGKLYFDSDGNGSGEQLLIATLRDAPVLAVADILVI